MRRSLLSGCRCRLPWAWPLLASLAWALAASADEPSAGPRLTAFVRQGADVRAGLVTADGISRLVREGESVGGWTVLHLDYERGEATLRSVGPDLLLRFGGRTADVDLAAPRAAVNTNFYSPAALERFYAEFPDLPRSGRARIALQAPAVVPGHGATIDQAIREQPGLGIVVDMVVTGQGPAIEGYLGAHPEASNAPDTTLSGYGPEIERQLERLSATSIASRAAAPAPESRQSASDAR